MVITSKDNEQIKRDNLLYKISLSVKIPNLFNNFIIYKTIGKILALSPQSFSPVYGS